MNTSICTKRSAPKLAAAMLGVLVWLLATACSGQNQSSGTLQASTPQTSLSAPSQSASPSTTGAAAGAATATAPATPAAASASPSSAPSKPAAAAPAPSTAAPAGKWNFDTDPVGGVPAGAQVFSGQWAVRAESDAPSQPNALCQTGEADFPAIGLGTQPHTDLTLVTRFKPISGKEDQAGGLIFRVQDRDNYYIVRANALEDNVIFFTYVGARRSQLKGAGAKVMNGIWHELRVDVRGSAFIAFLDGTQVVDVTDDRYKSGGIGIWTKSDSITCFDDVELTSS